MRWQLAQMPELPRVLRTLCLVSWVAVAAWYGFIQAPVLFRNFPTLAGEILEVIFPWYWAFGYACLGIAALLYIVAGLGKLSRGDFLRALILASTVGMLAFSQFVISPKIIQTSATLKTAESLAVSERVSALPSTSASDSETTPRLGGFTERDIARVRNEFGFWHATSQILNLLVFAITFIFAMREVTYRPRQSKFY